MKWDCDQLADDLSALIDGELPAQARARIEAHVAGCADCQARVVELRKLSGGIAAMPKTHPPPQFLTEVRRKISEGEQPRDASGWETMVESPWVQVPVRVAAVVAIFVGLAALITPAYHSYLNRAERGQLAKVKRPVEVATRSESATRAAAPARRDKAVELNQSVASPAMPPRGSMLTEEETTLTSDATAVGKTWAVTETIVVVDADASRVQMDAMKAAASLGGHVTRTIDNTGVRVYVELPARNVAAFRQRVLGQSASADRRLEESAAAAVEGRADAAGGTGPLTNEAVTVLEIQVVPPTK